MNCFIQYDIATFKFEAKQIMKFVLSAFISMKCKDIKNLMFIFEESFKAKVRDYIQMYATR